MVVAQGAARPMTTTKEQFMVSKIKKVVLALAALGALAFGGAQIAQGAGTPATSPTPAPAESTTGPDTDNVQSGDQSGTDTETADTAGAAEKPDTAAESASEVPGDDGPGGHADETPKQ
jgi:hypothetical protein